MISLLGIVFLLAVAWLFSTDRKAINPRTVLGALSIQILIAAFVLYLPIGRDTLAFLARGVTHILTYSQAGIDFLFGPLGNQSLGFVFVINVLPVIVFFSSLITVLYHLGIMTWIVRLIGGVLQKALKTSRPESLSAAANIFVGQAEAPLVVRPFVSQMTRSELFAIMVGGLSSIAGSVLAGYASLGVDVQFLLAACFMAAPGGLLMAKMIIPETGKPLNELHELDEDDHTYVNVFDAAATGALTGMQIAFAVGAMLLAFIAFIAMLNGIIGGVASLFGFEDITFQLILGYVFQPLAWVLGVPWNEANVAGSLIGQKLVLNEFVAYVQFVDGKENLSTLTQGVVTFALCGFANFSSIAILLGGIGAMAPTRRPEIAQLGLRALLAATLSNLMSAAIAGFFLSLG
ncbi:MAG: NupC/NupG family nucleoside CNT transporter [Pseudomonadales bacterium]|nr:NupC/NupG family nucleoside CNT transporter [Pseudomonadales bacterium]